jgi:hypothetical protein
VWLPVRHLHPGDRFAMVCDLIGDNFLAHQSNVVLVGGRPR